MGNRITSDIKAPHTPPRRRAGRLGCRNPLRRRRGAGALQSPYALANGLEVPCRARDAASAGKGDVASPWVANTEIVVLDSSAGDDGAVEVKAGHHGHCHRITGAPHVESTLEEEVSSVEEADAVGKSWRMC